MIGVLATELLKARRSRVPEVTALAFTVVALVGGLFMFILQDRERARSIGLLGTKASLAGGAADWPWCLLLTALLLVLGLLIGLVRAGVVQRARRA